MEATKNKATRTNRLNSTGNLAPTHEAFGHGGHSVHFYETEMSLAQVVSGFIQAGLKMGEGAVVIATPEHRAAIESLLEEEGVHLVEARALGQYVALDVAETLAKFMVNDAPDEHLFKEVLGAIIAQTLNGRPGLRAFGEMVAFLWERGNGAAATQLEKLWNQLQQTYHFELFCAYPFESFRGTAHSEIFEQICDEHTRVIPGESYSSAERTQEESLRAITLLQQKAASLELEITERKRSEEALQRARNELEQRVEERTAELKANSLELKRRNDQLARMASELTLAEQRERRRLAGLLHDDLQQLLVAAMYGLRRLSREFNQNGENPVDPVLGLLDECLKSSRSLTVELSPPVLHDGGLAAALQWLARSMEEKHNLAVELEIDPSVTTDREDIKILFFQAAREFLFNIVKHAKIDRARVELKHLPDNSLSLAVTDKGRGFKPEALWAGELDARGGFGLFSIRERLMLLDGRLEIDSAPGCGSRFTMITPLASNGH